MAGPEAVQEYKRHMEQLLNTSRDTRNAYRAIKKMDGPQLAQELTKIRAAVHGSIQMARERLFRATLQQMMPDAEVPWFGEDNDGMSDVSRIPIAWPEDDPDHQAARKKRRGRKPAVAQIATGTDDRTETDVFTEDESHGSDATPSLAPGTTRDPECQEALSRAVLSTPSTTVSTTQAPLAGTTVSVTARSSPLSVPRLASQPTNTQQLGKMMYPDYSWPVTYSQPIHLRWPTSDADPRLLPATTTAMPAYMGTLDDQPRVSGYLRTFGASSKAHLPSEALALGPSVPRNPPRPSEACSPGQSRPKKIPTPKKRLIQPLNSLHLDSDVEQSESNELPRHPPRPRKIGRKLTTDDEEDSDRREDDNENRTRHEKTRHTHRHTSTSDEGDWELVRRRRNRGTALKAHETKSRNPRKLATAIRRDRSSSDSSTTGDEGDSALDLDGNHQVYEANKKLAAWNLKFSGKGKDAADYLNGLNQCRISNGIRERDLLRAIPTTLTDSARRWFWSNRRDCSSWKEFRHAFKRRFVSVLSDREVRNELNARTQARGEKIASYLSCFKHIVKHFKHPPRLAEQLELAMDNMLPEYQDFMDNKDITSYADIEKYGQRLEKRHDRRERYQPPPPVEKTKIPGGAFEGGTRHSRIAAVREDTKTDALDSSTSRSSGRRTRPKSKRKVKKRMEKGVAAVRDTLERVTVSALRTKPESAAPVPGTAASTTVPPGGTRYTAMPTQDNGQLVRPNQGPWQSGIRRYGNNNGYGMGGNGPTGRNWTQGYNRGPNTARRPETAGPRANNGSSIPFTGACYFCQVTGHRAAECPSKACYICQTRGHFAANCPNRAAVQVSCQVCDRPGTTFKQCPDCAPLRSVWGNGQAGEQGRYMLPRSSQ